jgi:hypothetical protein
MECANCDTKIDGSFVLPSILKLTESEQRLMLDYVKSNGSPRKLGTRYNLSYPTIRKRLNQLISKLNDL